MPQVGSAAASATAQPPRARRYAAVGSVLALGAPLGWLALRAASSRRRRAMGRWARAEVRAASALYLYLTIATEIVFTTFGALLGRRQDKLDSTYREIERLREQFAGVIAHDLRDPVQAIVLQTGVLLREAREAEGEAFVSAPELRRLQAASARLSAVVNDLQDATLLELGRLELAPRTVEAVDVISALLRKMRPTLGLHPVALRVEGHPPPLFVDPRRFEQIMENLLENAAKYSEPEAPIDVEVRPQGRGTLITVRDRGVGIAPSEIPRLFDRFYQAARARREKTGLGLGLYITRGLVEAHGGKLRVESKPGEGSAFHVWLPG